MKPAPTAKKSKPLCKHEALAFGDGGRRLRCMNDDCKLTWVLESYPGSHIAYLGVIPLFSGPREGSTRLADGASIPLKGPPKTDTIRKG